MENRDVTASKTRRIVLSAVAEILLAVLAFLASAVFSWDVFAYGYSVAALFCVSSVFFSAISAALLAHLNLSNRTFLWLLAPALGFAAGAAMGFSPMMIPVWIGVFGGAELLYALYLKKTARLPFVAAFALLLGVCLGAILFLHVSHLFGKIEVSSLVQFVQNRSEAYTENLFATIQPVLEETGLAQGMLSEQYASVYATSLVLSLPGLYVSVIYFIAYVASFLLRLLTKANGALSLAYPDGFYPAPTIVTCIMYAVCLVSETLLASVLPATMVAALSTLQSALGLLFFFVGLSVIFREKRNGARRPRLGLVLALLVLVLFAIPTDGSFSLGTVLYFALMLMSIAVPVLSYIGLFFAVFAYVRERRENFSDSQKGM